MKKKLIISSIIIMLICLSISIPSTSALLTDQQVQNIVENFTGQSMQQVYKKQFGSGFDYLFTNLTGFEPYVEVVTTASNYTIIEVQPELVSQGSLPQNVYYTFQINPNYPAMYQPYQAVQGGAFVTENIQLRSGVVIPYFKWVWNALVNILGIHLAELHNQGIFFSDTTKITSVFDMTYRWWNPIVFNPGDYYHHGYLVGNNGELDAYAVFNHNFYWMNSYELWSWQIVEPDGHHSYDYGWERIG